MLCFGNRLVEKGRGSVGYRLQDSAVSYRASRLLPPCSTLILYREKSCVRVGTDSER